MKFYPTLQETLAKRFTDMDEVNDIVNHGIAGGFHGFIYTYELNQFFDEFENELESFFWDIYGADWLKEVTSFKEFSSLDELKCFMVWSAAEEFCSRKLDLMEAA